MFIGAIPVVGAIVAAVLAATVFATARKPRRKETDADAIKRLTERLNEAVSERKRDLVPRVAAQLREALDHAPQSQRDMGKASFPLFRQIYVVPARAALDRANDFAPDLNIEALEHAMGRVKYERTRGTRAGLDVALKKLNREIARVPDGDDFDTDFYARFARDYVRPALEEHEAGVRVWAKMKARGVKAVADLALTGKPPEGLLSARDRETL